MSSPSSTSTVSVDVAENRRATKFGFREQIARILWDLTVPFFRFTPRPLFWAWRTNLLRLFGAKVGKRVRINPSAKIYMPWNLHIDDDVTIGPRAILYSVGKISIGARAMISQHSHICAGGHDIHSKTLELTRPPITIGEDVWIAADAFVGPGINIRNAAVVSARAVVVSDVDPSVIVGGNPSRPLGVREVHS